MAPLSGALRSTRQNKAAPKIPKTLPNTAPISRRKLSARTRNSKMMTAPAAPAPTPALTKWMKKITDPAKKGHKKKAKQN